MRNPGLHESQAGIKTGGRNINNLRYSDNNTFMAESKEELKSLLMKVKEESEKAGLKLSIQKIKIMASGPITSWQRDGETVETVADFIFFFLFFFYYCSGFCHTRLYFLGLQSHCGQWVQPWNSSLEDACFFGRKAMTNLDCTLKSSDITLPTKVRIVKALVFPVVIYRCEGWTIKLSTKELTNWCLWTVVLEKTVKSPLDFKEIKSVNPKGSRSWIFIGRTDAEAEAPVLWPPDLGNWLIRKDPDAGKD